VKLNTPLLALGLAVLLAPSTNAFGEQYGLANMLSAAPSVADTIRPTERAGLRAQDLETPSRRQARQVVVAPVVSPDASLAGKVDWHEVVQSALRASAVASVAPVSSVPVRKDAVLDEPAVRPQTARDRLLVSVSTRKTVAVPVVEERIAPVVSDLGTFRARGLATDTSLSATNNTKPAVGVAHSTQIGRGAPVTTVHSQGYTQSE
jgi:hypothetical protein